MPRHFGHTFSLMGLANSQLWKLRVIVEWSKMKFNYQHSRNASMTTISVRVFPSIRSLYTNLLPAIRKATALSTRPTS